MLDKFKGNKNKQLEETITVIPVANIYGKDEHIILEVEMPGADKSSLDVSIDGNILQLTGVKEKDKVDKGYELVHQERYAVTYKRSFELSADIDRNDLKAEYVNGILKIYLKKSEKAQPKKIEIQI